MDIAGDSEATLTVYHGQEQEGVEWVELSFTRGLLGSGDSMALVAHPGDAGAIEALVGFAAGCELRSWDVVKLEGATIEIAELRYLARLPVGEVVR